MRHCWKNHLTSTHISHIVKKQSVHRMRVPIITDEAAQAGGWHGVALQQAFAARGVEAVFVELQDCVIDLSGAQPTINIPNFHTLPKMAFIRGIAAGTLQQVITRLNILHILRMQGVKVYNDAKAIERTVDKGMTSFLLKQHGVPTPATWVCESRHVAHQIITDQLVNETALVIKPLFGSQGQGVRLVSNESKRPLPKDTFVDGVYYLQSYIDSGDSHHDFRVFVVNNQAVASMRRSGSGWLNNVAQGASCVSEQDSAIEMLAIAAAKAVDIDYCGVDIMRDKDGQLWVLEVNSIPAWRGLQSVTEVNIAQTLVDDLMRKTDDE
jgi:tetrahydromethanopterin:alpha-L-glutamate ligase